LGYEPHSLPLREIADCNLRPGAVILDSRTLQSTAKSGSRAGYDGHKKRICAMMQLL
jgi:hypothetical protein